MGKYFLRTQKSKGNASVYLRVQKRNPKLNIIVCTQVSVDIQQWDRANKDVDKWNEYGKTKEGKKVKEMLYQISLSIDNLISQGIYEKAKIDEAVEDIVFREERERLRLQKEKEIIEEQKRELIKKQEENARKENIVLYLENFVKGIKSGEIKYKSENYSPNTCKVWNSFLKVFKRFYKIKPFTWKDIDKTLADCFISSLEESGYMLTTINKYIICFRAIVGYAMEQGFHNNSTALKVFTKKKVLEKDKAKEIYLTDIELQALYEMKLDGLKDQVRDVFLIGCYICQRFSDYSRLEYNNFAETENRTKIIRLVQKKTRKSIVIPILNKNLIQIMEKYNYQIPRISDVILNRYIKLILKDLSLTVPSLAEMERTVLTMKERDKEERGEVIFKRDDKGYIIRPRYELVSSHTARRSGITDLYLKDRLNSFELKSISGHSNEEIFNNYIKLTQDETADIIAQKFNSVEEENNNSHNV